MDTSPRGVRYRSILTNALAAVVMAGSPREQHPYANRAIPRGSNTPQPYHDEQGRFGQILGSIDSAVAQLLRTSRKWVAVAKLVVAVLKTRWNYTPKRHALTKGAIQIVIALLSRIPGIPELVQTHKDTVGKILASAVHEDLDAVWTCAHDALRTRAVPVREALDHEARILAQLRGFAGWQYELGAGESAALQRREPR